MDGMEEAQCWGAQGPRKLTGERSPACPEDAGVNMSFHWLSSGSALPSPKCHLSAAFLT